MLLMLACIINPLDKIFICCKARVWTSVGKKETYSQQSTKLDMGLRDLVWKHIGTLSLKLRMQNIQPSKAESVNLQFEREDIYTLFTALLYYHKSKIQVWEDLQTCYIIKAVGKL
jgi:hypothetical protein